jgi:transcriptional regulator GlxA family with amidase domain
MMSLVQKHTEISPGSAHIGQIADLLLAARDSLDIDRPTARMLVVQAVEMLDTAEARTTAGGLAPWQMKRVDAYIEGNITETLTLEQLASQAKLSASYFGRAFKVSAGETPHAYIMRKRVALARRLMLDTSASLAEIALDCGMADQSHMTRIFRRFTGTSPRAWRRTMTPA